jgi:hypothetical protein
LNSLKSIQGSKERFGIYTPDLPDIATLTYRNQVIFVSYDPLRDKLFFVSRNDPTIKLYSVGIDRRESSAWVGVNRTVVGEGRFSNYQTIDAAWLDLKTQTLFITGYNGTSYRAIISTKVSLDEYQPFSNFTIVLEHPSTIYSNFVAHDD